MQKEFLEKLIYKANIVSIFIVSISVISIILYAVVFFYPASKNEIIVKIDYPISIDTTNIYNKLNANLSANISKNDKSNKNKIESDNLYSLKLNFETKDLKKINDNNELLYKSIDSMLVSFQKNQQIILEEKKDREGFISFTSGILAIIIALSGFFGFKSINEMKNAAIESSREQAKIESRSISDSFIKEFIKTDLERITKNSILEVTSKYINPLEDRVSAIESNRRDDIDDDERNENDETKPFNDNQL